MKNLSKEEQLNCLDFIVAGMLDRYIHMYNRLRKAGLTPKEIILLKGLPLSKQEITDKIDNGDVELSNIDDKTSKLTIKNINF